MRETVSPMGMPDWWNTKRLGMLVHTTAAAVPAWAPIGQDPAWYRAHLGDELDDVVLHPQPMVEVLAHHRDRWGHIEHYDDFVPLLTFERFDAEHWARLARDTGAGYSMIVAKHHDGWSWWDAPNSSRRMTEHGPARNVLAEFAAACERNDLTFGTSYSLLDWGDQRYPSDDYVTDVLHRDVLDLVDRYGSSRLRGDGHWGHDAGHWRTADLLRAVRAINPSVIVDDRWRASKADVPDGGPELVRTFDNDCPDDITPGPWELTRTIGLGLGHNRNERRQHHLSGLDIVSLYTEVVAKGGNLVLAVGPTADGTVPGLQTAPMRDAGTWIRRYDHVLATSAPWATWGDATTRLVAGPTPGTVYAVDLAGAGRFATIDAGAHRITAAHRLGGLDGGGDVDVRFEQRHDGLRITEPPLHPSERFDDDAIGVAVYRLSIEPADRPIELFTPAEAAPIELAPLLAGARPGDIVQLGEGEYLGPAVVPSGVVMRGLGSNRTIIRATRHGIVAPAPALTVERSARIEHLAVVSDASGARSEPVAPVLVEVTGTFATILGCSVGGHVVVTGDDVMLRAVTGRGVVAHNADRLSVSRCAFTGNGWDVGVELVGGGGQTIESTRFGGHLCAVRATESTGTVIRGNTMTARWWGVHLDRTEDAHVHANHLRSTMRAVDVDGGVGAVIDGNAALGGDSGCLVQAGAARCHVGGNHWEDCRVGLVVWDSPDLTHHDNIGVDLHQTDGAVVDGP
ncbi:putative glycosidase [Ilumatobacter coccineus YM16-304]|uniref:alpha-L-fucosidase n=2 Tax=Ilumatobacter coccineus TaxID=467094 RepID=A0A6C7E4U1_ILUCY|nr:putative glycosidase [Ilumatobacter coccineus YM16-304]